MIEKQPLILCIETASSYCSVALKADKHIYTEISRINQSHAEVITVQIQNLCKKANIKLSQLNAIAVSKGPGSYTGLRIGTSIGKGLCFALNIPLIAIDTLKTMCVEAKKTISKFSNDAIFIPMLDARRMEVYLAGYDKNLNQIIPTQAYIFNEDNITYFSSYKELILFGNGALKSLNLFQSVCKTQYIENIEPQANNMIVLAEQLYELNAFENSAYFEPNYLKEFIAGKPNVKGLK